MVVKYAKESNDMLPVPNPTTSHWLSEPHPLANHRSTPSLPEECDVLIIGTGMAGVATAYNLSLSPSPPSIVLLEARQTCSGATGRNGGHVKIRTPSLRSFLARHGKEETARFHQFVQGIIYALKETVEREGLDCEFELRRSFDVYLDEGDAREAWEAYRVMVEEGCEWMRDISFLDERYAEKVTSVRHALAAINVPACSFWPYKFVTQLLARTLALNPRANLQTTTPVLSVSPDPANPTHTLALTPRGPVRAKKIVYATNAYTAGLLPQYSEVITPVKGTAASLAVPAASPKVQPHLGATYNIDFGGGRIDYFNPRPDGRIVLGGAGWLFKGDRGCWWGVVDDSCLVEGERVGKWWEGYMQRNFLGWEGSGCGTERMWSGIMGYTPDAMPHVGKVPGQDNAWILAGFNGGGMAMIYLCAKGVAEMVSKDVSFEALAVPLPGVFKTTVERLGSAGDV